MLRWLLGLFFVFAGCVHFARPGLYMRIMPPYLPWHRELVYLSGVCEIFLGVLLWLRLPLQAVLIAWAYRFT